MTQYESFDEFYERGFGRRCSELGERVSATLKNLLETKHLYQSSDVEFGELLNDFTDMDDAILEMLAPEIAAAASSAWGAQDKADRGPRMAGFRGVRFGTPDVKLFCAACDRTEAFNSVSTVEISGRGIYGARSDRSGRTAQTFALSFECQSCKGPTEVFLVRRSGMKLTLSGRAPIEYVFVPSAIPGVVRQWFTGAIVAHQSGQTLAGLFLLRTLIEQWARESTGDSSAQAVDLLELYKDSLPDDFKQRFPSLGDVYRKLSEDIHNARGSDELFQQSRHEITRHFEARRLFDL